MFECTFLHSKSDCQKKKMYFPILKNNCSSTKQNKTLQYWEYHILSTSTEVILKNIKSSVNFSLVSILMPPEWKEN